MLTTYLTVYLTELLSAAALWLPVLAVLGIVFPPQDQPRQDSAVPFACGVSDPCAVHRRIPADNRAHP